MAQLHVTRVKREFKEIVTSEEVKGREGYPSRLWDSPTLWVVGAAIVYTLASAGTT